MNVNQPIATNYGGHYDQFIERWKDQVKKLKAKFGAAIEEVRMPREYPTELPIVYVKKDSVVEVIAYMKGEAGFEYDFLSDITATDEEIEPRFEVVYNLRSLAHKNRIRVKARVAEGANGDYELPTLTTLWEAANWAEREVWDMFGVKFKGHPDLRRILMDERWQGHPLRKDYPLRGYQIFTTPEPIKTEFLE